MLRREVVFKDLVQFLITSMCVEVHINTVQRSRYKDIKTPRAGVTGSCEPLDMGDGNQTWVP